MPVIFSDSILLVSEDDTELSARAIIAVACFLLGSSFTKGIPIKGALAYGEQTADFTKSLYFGRPLIDAYTLQDELQMYGVVLHHSMENHLKQHGMIAKMEGLCHCELPLKGCNVSHYCVSVQPFFDVKKDDPVSCISKMYDTVSGNTRRYVDNTIQLIKKIQPEQVNKS